jgi:hypothetical protein
MSSLKETIVLTANYYSFSLSRQVLEMYVDDLSLWPEQKVIEAYKTYRRNPKNKSFPLPASIIEILNPTLDKKNVAIELSRKIQRCISRHGWNWEQGNWSEDGNYWIDLNNRVHWTFIDAVESDLGEIGWQAIRSRGGWKALCESSNEMDEQGFIAQSRDQISAELNNSELGVKIEDLKMPTPENPLQVSNVIELKKLIQNSSRGIDE